MVAIDPEHEVVFVRIGGSGDPLGAIAGGADPVGRDVVTELGNALADSITR